MSWVDRALNERSGGMIKAISIAIIAVFLFPISHTYILAKPYDIYGWNSILWGMTDKQIQNNLGPDLKVRQIRKDETENMYSGLELRDIIMGGTQLRASFWMSEELDKLSRIVFIPQVKPNKYEWAEAFIELENYLVKKYGPPDYEQTSNDPGTSADRKWVFPSTEIELSYLRLEQSELLLLVFSGSQ